METGKTLRGTLRLAFDAVEGVSHIVEGMHRNIAATPAPLGPGPEGRAPGIAGLVHAAVRGTNHLAREGSDLVLGAVSEAIDRAAPPGPHREAAIAVLNGVCGDHLEATGNPLAIDMRFRVFLPPAEGAPPDAAERRVPFGRLFEHERRPVEVHPRPAALSDADSRPGRRLLVVAHGLCMNDREWTAQGHDHARALAEAHGYTPLYLLYNTGRHVSSNGRELDRLLAELHAAWPVPVESITMIGFSMGGLVMRSALHRAAEEGRAWLDRVDKAVYVGTPHHGAVMERGGFWLQHTVGRSPYTAPLAALGRLRSDGITDLRHGNVCDDDWRHHDAHADPGDYRRPVPLAPGIAHHAIAATLSKGRGARIGRLLGDGLVHPSSATGRHRDPERELSFDEGRTRILYGLGHLSMLHDRRVAAQLHEWLAR